MRLIVALMTLMMSASVSAQEPGESQLQKFRCELHTWIEQTDIIRNWLNQVERNKLVFVNQQGAVEEPPQPILWKKAAGCSKTERTNNYAEKSG
jgi:hypothetical protein